MNPAKILVIDDEAAIRRFLKISLEADGFAYLEASSGQEGLAMAASHRPDLIVLDLGLPDLDGLTILKRIREWSGAPVIILTVKDAERDKVSLLDAGADDYLTKPFSVPELIARIRVALRHSQPQDSDTPFRSGTIEVDLAKRTVARDGLPVKLTATEYDLLRLLVKNAGRVLTQTQLLKEVWGPQAVEQTQYLRVFIGQLRKKLEVDPSRPRLILTEPGIGYRLSDRGDQP
jgi:two-component system KDP operon response regulator KdpE